MNKTVISTIIIISFVAYSAYQRLSAVPVMPAVTPTITPGDSSTPASSPAPNTGSGYKDGTYDGDAADAIYGNIQVRVTIAGGRITHIEFLQYPNDRGESVEINSHADPILAQEAIQAQNAQVDIVSGATDSSQAFIQSLGSALSKAKS